MTGNMATSMPVFILLIVVFASLLFTSTGASTVNRTSNVYRLEVSPSDGSFTIYIKNEIWFRSGSFFVHKNLKKFSTENNSLKFVSKSKEQGADKLGDYFLTRLNYELSDSDSSSTTSSSKIQFNIFEYESSVVFEQKFDDKLEGTSFSNSDSVTSSFPSFRVSENDAPKGYAQWISWLYVNTLSSSTSSSSSSSSIRRKALVAPGFDSPVFGLWSTNTTLYGGIGGSGVACFYNRDMSTSVVMSALDNVMAASHASLQPGTLSYGIMGNVTTIPADFSMKFIMHITTFTTTTTAADSGINAAIYNWGTTMRHYYDKPCARSARKKDVTLRYIGYTTDNGAYYYYNTVFGLNYEDTIIKIKEYADSVKIPYKYILLDSWWYFKGANGGVSQWTARPDVFPNGLVYLYNKTNWLVQAHNRYWAEDSVYSTENGGNFNFIEDHVKHGAAPNDEKFWDYLLGSPTGQDWGLRVYEQDWLHNEFNEYVGKMLETVDLGKTWLTQMSNGAEKNNITIQYCMPFIRHMLQSLKFRTVTQIRASDDYVVSPYDGADNWRIAGQTILIDALGAAPSKDGFWTTHYQPGNPYGEERFEPYPRFQAAIATLSAGPIQIADGIGYSDVALINKMIAKDGSLLQPSIPIKRLDAVMSADTFSKNDEDNNDDYLRGEVWASYTLVSEKAYMQIFVPQLANSWSLKPSDIFIPQRHLLMTPNYWAFEANASSKVFRFSEQSPVLLPIVEEPSSFLLYSVAPVLSNGWALQGEISKFVSISELRFISVSASNDHDLVVTVRITANESVDIGFISPSGVVSITTCINSFDTDKIFSISASGECIDL